MRSRSDIDHRQVRNILRAVTFAERQGRPLNLFVTLSLGHSACSVDRASSVFERLRDNHFTKWLRDMAHRKHEPRWLPPLYVWSIENKPGFPNVHWLVHVPATLRADFERKLCVWLTRLAGPLDNSQRPIDVRSAPKPIGAAKYLAKGIDPKYAKLYAIDAIPQGLIYGKRAGVSKALGPTAIAKATLVSLPVARHHTSSVSAAKAQK